MRMLIIPVCLLLGIHTVKAQTVQAGQCVTIDKDNYVTFVPCRKPIDTSKEPAKAIKSLQKYSNELLMELAIIRAAIRRTEAEIKRIQQDIEWLEKQGKQ